MIRLTDRQLQIVMIAAASLVVDKRACYLERVAAELGRVHRPDDQDVDRAVRAALRGLLPAPAA